MKTIKKVIKEEIVETHCLDLDWAVVALGDEEDYIIALFPTEHSANEYIEKIADKFLSQNGSYVTKLHEVRKVDRPGVKKFTINPKTESAPHGWKYTGPTEE